jgi:glycine/D-amino acid oxidase-like deaminating enzyme
LSDAVTVTQALGSPQTTAQVHPGQFTAAMMRAAEAQGAQLRHGRVSGITKREGRATGVEVNGAVIEGDAIVIAMGPWSILAASWLRLVVTCLPSDAKQSTLFQWVVIGLLT